MISRMLMKRVVPLIANSQRSPILRRPDEYGMEYEDVFFESRDGIPLEGWYMPAQTTSNKIVICNHFSPGNRYGYAGHIKPWKGAGGFEVNFIPKYKALVEAGYNVLAYDLRNHGCSGAGQNGAYNPKFFEYKDVLGSLDYVRTRLETKDMEIHLHSICLGGNSTLVAMNKSPKDFEGIKSMILIQPISGEALVKRLGKNMRLGKSIEREFARVYKEVYGFRVDDASPRLDAKAVAVPTFVVQVRNDSFTYAEEDVQGVFDAIPVEDKKLFWIEGTKQRFKGYTFFSEKPEQMVEWYNQH